MIWLALTLLCWQGPSGSKITGLPRTARMAKVQTFTAGVYPGSKVVNRNIREAKFVRVEYMPPSVVLLVRANCDVAVSSKELQEKAEQLVATNSGAQQLDWGKVNSKEKVSFYVVLHAKKRVTRYALVAAKEKYQPQDRQEKETPWWHVEKLNVEPLGICVGEKELSPEQLKIAMEHLLNHQTGRQLEQRFADLVLSE
jgi:hypothetical protein